MKKLWNSAYSLAPEILLASWLIGGLTATSYVAIRSNNLWSTVLTFVCLTIGTAYTYISLPHFNIFKRRYELRLEKSSNLQGKVTVAIDFLSRVPGLTICKRSGYLVNNVHDKGFVMKTKCTLSKGFVTSQLIDLGWSVEHADNNKVYVYQTLTDNVDIPRNIDS